MRLKTHREDVKDLKLMSDAHVQDIAKRYINLIRMAEYWFSEMAIDDDAILSLKEKRVLKDGGGNV